MAARAAGARAREAAQESQGQQAGAEQGQVAEEHDLRVLAGAQQGRRQVAGGKREGRQALRVTTYGQRDNARRDQSEKGEGHRLRHQGIELPGGVAGEVDDTGAEGRHPLGEVAHAPRREPLSVAGKSDAADQADQDSSRRPDPLVLERVAEEEGGREKEREDAETVEPAAADESLQVDVAPGGGPGFRGVLNARAGLGWCHCARGGRVGNVLRRRRRLRRRLLAGAPQSRHLALQFQHAGFKSQHPLVEWCWRLCHYLVTSKAASDGTTPLSGGGRSAGARRRCYLAPHDRPLLLAHSERLEGLDSARGDGTALPRRARQHRSRGPVQTGVPAHQPEQPDAGDHRPRTSGRRRAAGDVRVRRHPPLPGGEERPVPAPGRPRALRRDAVGDVADGQSRPDAGPAQSLHTLRTGKARLRDQALPERSATPFRRAGRPTGRPPNTSAASTRSPT